jgi:catechol 2,3-dioxygenase-like lactoylglutathione lyase family enzyme
VAAKKKRSRKIAAPALVFNHAMVYVRELAPALHFYADLLGFKVIEQYPQAYARLRSPRSETTLALHIVEPGKALPPAGGVRLYFETRDLDKLCANLETAGVRFTQPPKLMPWGWKHAYLDDPDGHEVSLYWAGKKRLQEPRAAR